MKLVDMYDGFMVLEIHWTEARHVVEALKEYQPNDTHQGLHVDSLATAFEAGTYAGKLQVRAEVIAQDVIPMSRFRRQQGLRNDWADGYEVARDDAEQAAEQPGAAD